MIKRKQLPKRIKRSTRPFQFRKRTRSAQTLEHGHIALKNRLKQECDGRIDRLMDKMTTINYVVEDFESTPGWFYGASTQECLLR